MQLGAALHSARGGHGGDDKVQEGGLDDVGEDADLVYKLNSDGTCL